MDWPERLRGRLVTHGKLQAASIGGLVSGLRPQKRIHDDDENKDGCPCGLQPGCDEQANAP